MRLILLLLIVSFVTLARAEFSFIILHNNDMHGRFEETIKNSAACTARDRDKGKCLAGMARTAYELKRHRQLAANNVIPKVLFLNAGDIFTGTAWYSVHKTRICAEFINALQPDALSLGNHEFDNGVAGLAPYIQNIRSPVVAANLDFSLAPELQKIQKSVILQVDGRSVGIIGYLTNETVQISNPGVVKFRSEIDAIREESERLDREGVKIIIAVGHSGYLVDQAIAAQCPLVDIVVGGHTNTFLYNGPQPDIEEPEGPYPTVVTQPGGKKVPVVQAYAYTKYLGRLNVTFDDEGNLIQYAGQPIFMSHDIPQDPGILKLLDKFRPEVEKLEYIVIGKTKVLLDASQNICRFKECNFGNLIADAFIAYVSDLALTNYWTDYPIALVNGGGVRNTIDASSKHGSVTRADLLAAQPFGNQLITCSLNGTDLLQTLELGVRSNGETSRGEFLQFSGIHVVYDLSKPPGSRVVSAKARCGHCLVPVYESIMPNKTYNIVTTGFLMDGGDGHTALKEKHFNKRVQDLTDFDTIAWYLQKISPVYPEIQGRIRFLSDKGLLTENRPKVSNGVTSYRRLIPKTLVLLIIPTLLKFF